MTPRTIAFFGNFGTRNLGNEATLHAVIHNARRYLPDAQVTCICPDPQDTSEHHHVPAFLMSYRYSMAFTSRAPHRSRNPMLHLLRRLFIRVPLEIREWLKAFRVLKDTDMLIMTGTGMLGDFGAGGPLGLHYEILKWSLLAKLRRSKLFFLSVGAGPLDRPLSRWILRAAVPLADYRSYRDRFSQSYLDSAGFNTSGDSVYPDLVFSFPTAEIPPSGNRPETGRVVGLGLMEYYGTGGARDEGERRYQLYVRQVARFVAWLLAHEYAVRLLVGDLSYDQRVRGDVCQMLDQMGVISGPGRLINEPISSVENLCAQLAQTDIVVASRFHNVLLALLLNRPVLALSYHAKVDSLMADVGLAEYRQSIAQVDVERLTEQFSKLEQNARGVRSRIAQKTMVYRDALDRQYGHIFANGLPQAPGWPARER